MDMDRRTFIGGILAAGSAPMLFNGCATGFLDLAGTGPRLLNCL